MASAAYGASVPALQRTVLDLVEEYDQKAANIAKAIADYDAAFDRLGMAATVQGCFVEPVGSKSYLSEKALQKNLLSSGWRAIYNRLEIGSIASAKDKQLFDRTLADPPPLTFDNAKATFRDYLERPRFHILRGLAEVFADLDPAYKSHSKVRIGVKGLPKRIIMQGWGDFSYGYARDRFTNICNALAAYRVLEPSCGDGRILDELRARGCRALGVEYHAPRAAEARAKGHSVVTGNFLEQAPVAEFDKIVMNPPFYGRHYVKHVSHAYKFLKPGGTLVSILPATAHYDHGELRGEWRDLPVGSFSDAGTNVPTGLLRMRKAA